jgi:hypothetical protein
MRSAEFGVPTEICAECSFRILHSALRILVFLKFVDPPAKIIDRAAVFEKIGQVTARIRVGECGNHRREELQCL